MTYPSGHPNRNNSNIFTGIIIIIIGIGVLFRIAPPFKELIPYWVTSWPMLLIVIGLLIGIRDNFRNNAWIVLLLVGSAFLLFRHGFLPRELRIYVLPIGIILFGLYIMFSRRNPMCGNRIKTHIHLEGDDQKKNYDHLKTEEDFISINSIMGSADRMVISKKFTGGDVSCIMGGVQINCTQAEIEEVAVLNLNIVFGGLELRLPSNWEVKNQATVIAGGIDDKRNFYTNNAEGKKMLIIKGLVMFGGIEIKN